MAATLSAVQENNFPENMSEEQVATMADPAVDSNNAEVTTAVKKIERRDSTPSNDDVENGGSSPESDPDGLADTEGTPRNSDSGMKVSHPVKVHEVKAGKKSQEGSSKSRKKEDKSIEHVLKALSSLSSTEEKLAALCKKYTDLLDEHRLQQNSLKQTQRKLNVTTREKDQLQNEHSKAVLAKSKLENLCRELQRNNKLVKEESLIRAREEEEKRKEVSAKFQTTIQEIQTQMAENGSRNNKLKEENTELAVKLKGLIEQYEKREEHIEKVLKHKDLENQLAEAKLNQTNLFLQQEKEQHEKEKQLLLDEVTKARGKLEFVEANENQLKTQLGLYTEKYEDFQSTLTKSNEVFTSFKTEMDKMTKKIKKLEKDSGMYRTRWENSQKALLEMAGEKTNSDKEIGRIQTKNMRLEKLCRALQAERNKEAGAETGDAAADNEAIESLEVPVHHDILPTSTPPNTPDQSSRSSPVNVSNNANNETSVSDSLEQTQSSPAESNPSDSNGGNSGGDNPENLGQPVIQETKNERSAAETDQPEKPIQESKDDANDTSPGVPDDTKK